MELDIPRACREGMKLWHEWAQLAAITQRGNTPALTIEQEVTIRRSWPMPTSAATAGA